MDKKEYNLEQNLKELEELISLYGQQPDEASCKAIVEKAESIYENYSDSEKLALGYAIALVILSTQQTELQEMEASVAKLQVLHQQFPDSPDIALGYAKILVNLSAEQTELKELAATVEKIQVLHQQFPDSPDIALEYAKILFNLSIEQTELKELAATVEKIQILHQQFPDSPDIVEVYATTLANLSDKQPELKERAATVEKIQILHQQFPDSPDIVEVYATTLANLSDKQPELKERAATVEKIQILHQQFPDSPDIAEMYAMTLFNLSTKQTELNELETTAKELKVLHQHERFQESEEIAFIYVMFLASLFEHQTELSERLQATKIIKQLYEQFSTFMLQSFDNLFFSNDNVCDSEEYKLFNFILREGLLKNTKYAILQTWAKRYKEDSNELKNLLSIYQYVQKIKYQLGLKNEDKNKNLKFGHYTKGSVLQSLLDQKEESSFSIVGKTRLNNANYMNDPEEGIIIEKILGLDRRDALEPSSWFLMSFTIKTDDLAMWSQYGDDAKGVCLVLREDDFSRFSSFNDVSWRREKISLEFSDKMYLMKSELNIGFEKSAFRSESENSINTVNDEGTEPNSEEKGNVSKGNVDYLYRIAYVNDSGGKFSIEKTELFNDYEIKNLETLLKALKGKIDKDLDKGDDFYQKAISDCIEEIRYLFKSVDYKYEDELRILRYANLDPSNDKIKIDKESGIGKLYVERENPIQIDEVIFGPKFPNPEYVTPLLKLLDKEINYKKSTIKFR
ncbi:DUF2971 domain-containing protein [Streptococcus cristatus]|uniref:DUF2971 domain-containing protein n=1 Tax=Streptococcus cristatus TaxID=45634 RepID=UPI0039C42863